MDLEEQGFQDIHPNGLVASSHSGDAYCTQSAHGMEATENAEIALHITGEQETLSTTFQLGVWVENVIHDVRVGPGTTFKLRAKLASGPRPSVSVTYFCPDASGSLPCWCSRWQWVGQDQPGPCPA